MLALNQLKPLQAMVASLFFHKRKLLVALPRQEGKTELGVRLLHSITSIPTSTSSLFLAKDKKSGKKATREKFIRLFDESKFRVNTEMVYLKENPSSVIFMDSVDKEPDRIRGGTYSMIHWSEVAFSKLEKGVTIETLYDKIIQPTTRKTKGYVFLESTNNGKNGWYDLWENYRELGFNRFKVGLSDLVYMGLVSRREYDEIQSTTLPEIFEQEYECNFVSFKGRAYPEFDENIHVRKVDSPKDWQKTIFAIDWGFHPSATCILFAYVEDGILYVFDEHYEHKELATVTADNLELIKQRHHILRTAGVADHEEDRIRELTMRGIECGKAKKTDMLGARMSIKERLYFKTIVIDPKCKFLRRDLLTAVWDDKKDGDIDYSQCSWGHYDAEAALRYLIRELGEVEAEKPFDNIHSDSVSAREAAIINQIMRRS